MDAIESVRLFKVTPMRNWSSTSPFGFVADGVSAGFVPGIRFTFNNTSSEIRKGFDADGAITNFPSIRVFAGVSNARNVEMVSKCSSVKLLNPSVTFPICGTKS